MTGQLRPFWSAAIAILITLLATTTSSDGAHAGDPHVTAFLKGLIGSWTGRAETTPVGPRPYDMTFKRLADGRTAATANPGRSVHHWWFSATNGRLHLTFLTTFQGNRDPQQFLPATFKTDEAVFATNRTDRLMVRVLLRHERLQIDVLRHGRLHIAIRLVKERVRN